MASWNVSPKMWKLFYPSPSSFFVLMRERTDTEKKEPILSRSSVLSKNSFDFEQLRRLTYAVTSLQKYSLNPMKFTMCIFKIPLLHFHNVRLLSKDALLTNIQFMHRCILNDAHILAGAQCPRSIYRPETNRMFLWNRGRSKSGSEICANEPPLC